MVRILIASVSVLFLSGCATLYNPATGKNEVIFINTATEVSMGRSAAAELTKKHPLSSNQALQDRVVLVGKRVSAVSDRLDLEYKFAVLADKELNAMAFPGAFIYINEGLIKILNDDELAYVLGHEIGHVAARHIVKKLQAAMPYQLSLGIAFALLGEKGNTPVAQGVSQGIDTIYNLVSLGYSRQDEYQADALGVKYAHKSGFNPNSAITALEKIKGKGEESSKLLEYLRSHPYTDDRIKALKPIIAQVTGKI